MTSKMYSGVCMTLIRKQGDYRFFSTTFGLDLTSAKRSLKGKLAPGRSDRSFVLLINPGSSRFDIVSALKKAAEFIQSTKPGSVDAVAVPLGKKQNPALIVAALIVDEAETLNIETKKQLEEPNVAFPYAVVYAPASLRHWQDAYDDLRALAQEVEDGDLPRGFIKTPLGVLSVREGEDGFYAEIETARRYRPARRSGRFNRPTWPEDTYFGLDDDEEDEEEDDGEE